MEKEWYFDFDEVVGNTEDKEFHAKEENMSEVDDGDSEDGSEDGIEDGSEDGSEEGSEDGSEYNDSENDSENESSDEDADSDSDTRVVIEESKVKCRTLSSRCEFNSVNCSKKAQSPPPIIPAPAA